MSYLKFIRTKTFVKHFFIASISALVMLWLVFKLFSVYTHHGVTYPVPDFSGQSVLKLNEFIKDKKVRYQIIDSIYDAKQAPGTIIRQDPEKGAEVKENRVIYLYVTSVMPPQIEMPKLDGRSLRQAIAMIESYGLKPGKITWVADPFKNAVIKQFFKGKEITPGTRIKKGSVIDLAVGKGTTSETISLPNCVGLTFCDAKNKLLASALQVGGIMIDKTIGDTCEAFVYRQTPAAGDGREVSSGARVDLYITDDKSKIKLSNNDENN
ncbi:MAG TPA: PASTA domain-containing protein [Bacteroidia bacterium]|jgi:beta-lactam-binding protein with PASTA domain|nr:PASTA domain-containing protein [Bacteroidia bacterium]